MLTHPRFCNGRILGSIEDLILPAGVPGAIKGRFDFRYIFQYVSIFVIASCWREHGHDSAMASSASAGLHGTVSRPWDHQNGQFQEILARRYVLKSWLQILPLLVTLNCIPGTKPSENTILPGLLALRTGTIPDTRTEAVRSELIDEVLQDSGDYAVRETEREFLTSSMEQRYYAGFYEQESQSRIAQHMKEILQFAQDDAGKTVDDIREEFVDDIRANLPALEDPDLMRIRLWAGDSLVMAEEMKRNPNWELEGIDPQMLARHIESMRTLRRQVTDELRKRHPGEEL